MKKIAFISDIHSNLEALESVLKDIEKENVDQTYCLGDLVGYGPNPNEIIELIRKKNIITVMGNYDDAVGYEKESCGCSYNPGRETEVGDESLSWTIKNTTKENKNFLKLLLKKLVIEIEDVKILLVHGSPLNYLLEYVKPETNSERLKIIAKSIDEDIVINGHTHLMMAKHLLGKTILNPGSVGRTKDGKPGATYLILEVDKDVFSYRFKFVEYNIKKTIEKIIKVGLPVELATVLALGKTLDMGKAKNKTNDIGSFKV
ncbi:metallophosphatase [Thermosipho melanesiensis]|uniref:Phosphoesterase n=2 Tax=Thermosipho melanesiensis TaxID=46541 RepID=A6LL29_THEM4|nr:YfcE family phosphodiesterase [Thermosipho melanesiensis]ABR30630.1 phosphodiesterase, MJ0936 family [Thermosipho melanesiensis BI429]APT73769.1 metallophosphatase [Thermosipho melanesiensis]OOC35709.1 metallophosphatase [Thermosipho melanesiensis]OOC39008.1 metallophosphatase [Thermosipho melanesiensis]OOC39156.1 metallophosphatase [Thermosipho melanesiensis]